MRTLIAIAIALLAGCGTTPAELRASGKHFTTKTKLAPDVAARCLLRAAENGNSDLRGRVLPIESGGYEVLIWHDAWSRVLAEFKPDSAAGVTLIEAWYASGILDVEQDGGVAIANTLRSCR